MFNQTADPQPRDEARLRRLAYREGLIVRKFRLRGPAHIDNYGGYRLVDAATNRIEAGERFDLSFGDLEGYLTD